MDPADRRAGDPRPGIGVCPQEDTLDTELNVRDNLYVYGRYFGLPRAEVRERVDELLEFVQLTEKAEGQGRGPLRRHEAAAHDRPLADQPARPAAARRADHRPRPAGPPRRVGPAVPAQAAGRDAGAHHALHGRGRAALRPARRDGQGPDRRRGLAARADPRSTPPARSPSCASASASTTRCAEKVADLGERVEVLPDRLLRLQRRRRGGRRQGARARPRARSRRSCAAPRSRTSSSASPAGRWSTDGRPTSTAAGAPAPDRRRSPARPGMVDYWVDRLPAHLEGQRRSRPS